MAINNKDASKFDNVELEVELRSIIIQEDEGKVTLVFYSPAVKNEYRKSYLINDIKGRIDFNRVLISLGSTRSNYRRWLNKILVEKIMIKISVNEIGFVRYIKVLDKSVKEYITKSIIIDTIEGSVTEEDYNTYMGLTLKELKKELGI